MPDLDAVVVGAGPNGLAAAIELARAGWSVKVIEAADTVGGGSRTAEVTLPGFRHDVCSAIHPLGLASPFFRSVPLADHGLEWVQPDAPLAHPMPDGTAAVLERSVDETADAFGEDGRAYRGLMNPMLRSGEVILEQFLGPVKLPRHPFTLVRFGLRALRSVSGLAGRFSSDGPKALFAGLAAHSMLKLDQSPTGAYALTFGMLGHLVGWPMAKGGSQAIVDAMASYLRELGGQIEAGRRIGSLDELPQARAVLLDVTPRQFLAIAGDRVPSRYRRALERYRYGPGVCKVDWALDAPIPWKADGCERAATVHVGGTIEELDASENAVWRGEHAERPFVVLAQQTPFDPSRAPQGKHTAWAYCHVPNGSDVDMTERIEEQVERFAPGFRDRILGRRTVVAADLERYDENYVGGDINGGLQDLGQLFSRPTGLFSPYETPLDGVFLCSSSTPPGGGVHGMCGHHATKAALKKLGPKS
ncbi:MAG: NAD(P)/FAD-dependent oxidoreductase [Actinomycetota bacterium]|nr:NAD(P)/FAD-dependent oxidoreductase [Actinomycetota bacterium]